MAYKTYTRAQKKQARDLYIVQDKDRLDISTEMGVPYPTICRWLKNTRAGKNGVTPLAQPMAGIGGHFADVCKVLDKLTEPERQRLMEAVRAIYGTTSP